MTGSTRPGRRLLAPARVFLVIVVVAAGVSVACRPRTVPKALDDATITAGVKTSLLNDTQISAIKIDVSTSAGVVTLSGTVGSQAEAERAVQLARQVAGVRDVRSTLRF